MEKNMIGKYLRDLRRRRGMSQQELALALGVSKQTISNWEVGRKVPRMKAVDKIANIFGVSRNSILAGLPVEMLEQADTLKDMNLPKRHTGDDCKTWR